MSFSLDRAGLFADRIAQTFATLDAALDGSGVDCHIVELTTPLMALYFPAHWDGRARLYVSNHTSKTWQHVAKVGALGSRVLGHRTFVAYGWGERGALYTSPSETDELRRFRWRYLSALKHRTTADRAAG